LGTIKQPRPRRSAGNVPLGYDASERTLVINPAEAETVRRIFALYRELGCVRRVKGEADRLGLRTKCRTTANGTARGGKLFSRGHLYTLLSNPIYTGRIAHKGELHLGQQPALIDDETWVAVRDQLAANTSDHRRKAKNARRPRPAAASSSLKAAAIYNEPGEGGTAEEWRINPPATALTKNEIIVSGLKQGWLPHCGRSLVWRTDWTGGSKPLSIDTPIKSVEFVRTSSTTPPQADRQPVSDPTHPSLRGTGRCYGAGDEEKWQLRRCI
jgi:hypothetical protein